MAVPKGFLINDRMTPFPPEVLVTLSEKQQRLERAIGGTKYVARSIRALARETGLSPASVRAYCEACSHIARSPVTVGRDGDHFGYIVRLREKYDVSDIGEVRGPDLRGLGALSQDPPDVFFSYAHADAALAREFEGRFRRAGLRCYLAEKNIDVGADFSEDIRDALRGTRAVVLLLTQLSKDRPWVLLEAGAAWALGKSIFCALDQVSTEELAEPLRRRQARVVRTNDERGKFVKEVAKLIRAEQESGRSEDSPFDSLARVRARLVAGTTNIKARRRQSCDKRRAHG